MSHSPYTGPLGDDPLGTAVFDYWRSALRGEVRYVDGTATRPVPIRRHYFTPRSEWPDAAREDLTALEGPVADVGCGPAQHLLWFRDEGLDAVGVDVSPGMLTAARERLARTPPTDPAAAADVTPGDVSLLRGDLFALPLATDAVGGAWLNGTQLGIAGSIAGVRAALAELDRVTRPGGRAVVDSYAPERMDVDGLGFRPDPREGVAYRTFHVEYERETASGGERLVGPTLQFVCLDPFRLRAATRGTQWSVERIRTHGSTYTAVLER